MLTISPVNKRFVIPFAATTVILVVAVISFVLLLNHHSFLEANGESCYFSRELHLYCPGCGGSRAMLRLLEGNVIASLLSNPFPVYFGFLIVRMWVALFHNAVFCKEESRVWPVLNTWEALGIPVVIVGFFIIRNVLLIFFGVDYLGDFM